MPPSPMPRRCWASTCPVQWPGRAGAVPAVAASAAAGSPSGLDSGFACAVARRAVRRTQWSGTLVPLRRRPRSSAKPIKDYPWFAHCCAGENKKKFTCQMLMGRNRIFRRLKIQKKVYPTGSKRAEKVYIAAKKVLHQRLQSSKKFTFLRKC